MTCSNCVLRHKQVMSACREQLQSCLGSRDCDHSSNGMHHIITLSTELLERTKMWVPTTTVETTAGKYGIPDNTDFLKAHTTLVGLWLVLTLWFSQYWFPQSSLALRISVLSGIPYAPAVVQYCGHTPDSQSFVQWREQWLWCLSGSAEKYTKIKRYS